MIAVRDSIVLGFVLPSRCNLARWNLRSAGLEPQGSRINATWAGMPGRPRARSAQECNTGRRIGAQRYIGCRRENQKEKRKDLSRGKSTGKESQVQRKAQHEEGSPRVATFPPSQLSANFKVCGPGVKGSGDKSGDAEVLVLAGSHMGQRHRPWQRHPVVSGPLMVSASRLLFSPLSGRCARRPIHRR